MRRRIDNTLDVRWSKKERDLVFRHDKRPPDGHMLHSVFCYVKGLGGKTFVEELESRGFDITTLRFSILRKGNEDGP